MGKRGSSMRKVLRAVFVLLPGAASAAVLALAYAIWPRFWIPYCTLLLALAVTFTAVALARVRQRRLWRALLLCGGISLGFAVGIGVHGLNYSRGFFDMELRSAWLARVRPARLGAALRPGMTPAEVVEAMGLEEGALAEVRWLAAYGVTRATAIEAMGAYPELVTPKGADGTVTYYVWCYPLCSTLGCCDGTILVRFTDGKLAGVSIYDPVEGHAGADPSSDFARYDPRPVQSMGALRLFSPTKTLDAILASKEPGRTLVGAPAPPGGSP
jgi:hypothetical protein